jgi:hypothetical protein
LSIRFHVERQVDALVERGFSPQMAMKRMGNVERQMEQCHEVRGIGGKVVAYLICGEARLGVVLMSEAVCLVPAFGRLSSRLRQ